MLPILNIVFCFASVLVVGLNLNVKYVCVPGWEFVISIVKQNDLIEWLHHLKFLGHYYFICTTVPE